MSDILVTPDREAGNILTKTLTCLARAVLRSPRGS
jgi:phosphotransacetylase